MILDVAIKMILKMPKKLMPRVIMLCSFAVMLLIDLFALRISSIILILAAAAVSLAVFLMKGKDAKGGSEK